VNVTRERSVIVTPEGGAAVTAHVSLTRQQARTLRDYARLVLGPMHLDRKLQCNECGATCEIEINDTFCAIGCGCTLRTYSGPTALVTTHAPREPEFAPAIVSPDGTAAARYVLPIADDQARLLRDYKRSILLELHLREGAYCRRCYESSGITLPKMMFAVLPNRIDIACGCTERHYRGITA
jgi:hypothetical protein